MFAVALAFERPLVTIAVIAVAVFKAVFLKQTVSLSELFPDRPPGGFDLTTMIVFAGMVWALAGAILGAVLGTKGANDGSESADVPLT